MLPTVYQGSSSDMKGDLNLATYFALMLTNNVFLLAYMYM